MENEFIKKEILNMDYKMIENEIIAIYENENKEKLVNARELHSVMKVGRDFTNWVKDRIKKYDFIENEDYILTLAKIGERQNVIKHEYYLTINMAKEIAMVENNEMGRKIRRYFIEVGLYKNPIFGNAIKNEFKNF